jgi:hypothetical protein
MSLIPTSIRKCAVGTLLASCMIVGAGGPILAQDSTPPAGESEIAAQLPAADLPDMNENGFILDLESTWTGSFDAIASEAPVIRMDVQQFDAAAVTELAGKLGIQGEVEDQGEGTFQVTGEGGNLFVTAGLQQYVSSAEIPEGTLPGDDEAIAYAREWLRQSSVLPADAGDGRVVSRVENPPRVIVSIEPQRPENLISQYPAITVTLGPDGVVIEAGFRWSDLSAEELYALRPVGEAWTDVSDQRSAIQAEVPADFAEPGATLKGNATFENVIIAYTTSGRPGETQYLQPVYVFTGSAVFEGSDQAFPVTAYVPALVNSEQPVG